MTRITAIFWDVGGVVLTNGWDRAARRRARDQFELDGEDFQDRHELVNTAFETGRMSLDEYLGRTVFYRPRRFSRDEFKAFMFSQSEAKGETVATLAELGKSCRWWMATLNNESAELNEYRIERFGLRNYFTAFFSSCYLGIRKPDPGIYRQAAKLSQRPMEQCLFIDDRALNLECAKELGMRTIHFQSASQLNRDLQECGVAP